MKNYKTESPWELDPRDQLTIKHDEDSFNPYERTPVDAAKTRPVKRDLRKLSEWIKTLRVVEANKANGGD